jgi:hypothetical protein
MSIESAPYFWIVCDNCGERDDYDTVNAWGEAEQAVMVWEQSDHHVKDGKHYCTECVVWCGECGGELVPDGAICHWCESDRQEQSCQNSTPSNGRPTVTVISNTPTDPSTATYAPASSSTPAVTDSTPPHTLTSTGLTRPENDHERNLSNGEN